jgi:hypothetical protein
MPTHVHGRRALRNSPASARSSSPPRSSSGFCSAADPATATTDLPGISRFVALPASALRALPLGGLACALLRIRASGAGGPDACSRPDPSVPLGRSGRSIGGWRLVLYMRAARRRFRVDLQHSWKGEAVTRLIWSKSRCASRRPVQRSSAVRSNCCGAWPSGMHNATPPDAPGSCASARCRLRGEGVTREAPSRTAVESLAPTDDSFIRARDQATGVRRRASNLSWMRGPTSCGPLDRGAFQVGGPGLPRDGRSPSLLPCILRTTR